MADNKTLFTILEQRLLNDFQHDLPLSPAPFADIAQQLGVSEEEILQLSRPDGRLDDPKPGDNVEDAAFGRTIYLRRTAGKARVTIFEGGHEGIAPAALDWLSRWP